MNELDDNGSVKEALSLAMKILAEHYPDDEKKRKVYARHMEVLANEIEGWED